MSGSVDNTKCLIMILLALTQQQRPNKSIELF